MSYTLKANYFISHFGWHPDIPANEEYNLHVHFSEPNLKENKSLDKIMAEQVRCISKYCDQVTLLFSLKICSKSKNEC